MARCTGFTEAEVRFEVGLGELKRPVRSSRCLEAGNPSVNYTPKTRLSRRSRFFLISSCPNRRQGIIPTGWPQSPIHSPIPCQPNNTSPRSVQVHSLTFSPGTHHRRHHRRPLAIAMIAPRQTGSKSTTKLATSSRRLAQSSTTSPGHPASLRRS